MSIVRQVARAVGDAPRAPGSEAERAAAERVAEWLRARGDAPQVRERRAGPELAAVGLGSAVAALGSLVSVGVPVAGAAAAATGALVIGADRLPLPRRPTRDVVVTPAGGGRVPVIVCARLGSGRRGFAFGDRAQRLATRLRRPWSPDARVWLVLAALAVVVAAGARAAGAGGVWLGAAQLVPTVALLVAAGAALDAGLAGWATGERSAAAVAVAVAVHDELVSQPPRAFAPGLLLAGAGPLRPPAGAVVVEIAPLGSGPARWRTSHPGLRAAATRAAAALGSPAGAPLAHAARGRGEDASGSPAGAPLAHAAAGRAGGEPGRPFGAPLPHAAAGRAGSPAGAPLLARPPRLGGRPVIRIGGGEDGAVDLALGIVDALDAAVQSRPSARRSATGSLTEQEP